MQGACVLPILKQLMSISKNIVKNTLQKDKVSCHRLQTSIPYDQRITFQRESLNKWVILKHVYCDIIVKYAPYCTSGQVTFSHFHALLLWHFLLLLQSVINEINRSSDVIKLVTNSLVKCHKLAVAAVGDGQLKPSTMVDGKYPHSDVSFCWLINSWWCLHFTMLLVLEICLTEKTTI